MLDESVEQRAGVAVVHGSGQHAAGRMSRSSLSCQTIAVCRVIDLLSLENITRSNFYGNAPPCGSILVENWKRAIQAPSKRLPTAVRCLGSIVMIKYTSRRDQIDLSEPPVNAE